MNETTEAKFREILHGYYDESNGSEDDVIAQIEQVLREEGYSQNIQTLATRDIEPMNLVEQYVGNGKFEDKMTGQEWYDRFISECNQESYKTPKVKDVEEVIDWLWGEINMAAKRAAGLE